MRNRTFFASLRDLSRNNLSRLHMNVFATATAVHTINISSNALQNIPSKLFGDKSSLRSLDLCCNKLQSLSDEIFSSTKLLISVRLQFNHLRRLPLNLFSSTPKLEYLRVSQNKLEDIPESIFFNVPELHFLDLCSNHLKALPEKLFNKNTKIGTIKLTDNELEELSPKLFANGRHLRTLYLKRNMLKQIHQDLFKFNPNMATLWLSFNKLDKIPENLFANLSRLSRLDLSNNNINELPEQVWRGTPKILKIDLSNNQLHSIPPNIFSSTTDLQYLQLDRNQMREIPNLLFASTPNLESLDLGNNYLSSISPELFHQKRNLRVLKLVHNELTLLPDGLLATTPALTTINVGYNKLQTLPTNVFQSTPLLSYVDLSYNQLSEIATTLFNTTEKLTSLILNHNDIRKLPDNLFKRAAYPQNLDFSLCRIEELSKGAMDGLRRVSSLSVAGNKITSIDADVFSEVSLSNKLDVSYNLLRTLPNGLFVSKNTSHALRILFLQRNVIEHISRKAFAGLYLIKYILLYNNKIHTLSDGAFLDTGAEAIYLFGNDLSEIVGNPFDNDNITELHLYGNKIKSVAKESILGLKTNTSIYMDCGELTMAPWAPRHVSIKCVSAAFVPTINISLASVPTALRSQGFNCTINKRSDSQCEPCRPGTFGAGITGCHPCPPGGYYQDEIGQAASSRNGTACKDCNIGTFVKGGGGTSIRDCLVCPEGTNQTTKAGFRACKCKTNYTRTYRFGPCELCLEEGLNCTSQEYKSLVPGYYWNWTFDKANLTQYVGFAKNLEDESRFYDELYINYSGEIPKIFKCERVANCPNKGNTTLQRIEGRCESGYRGWMCSKCVLGYYSILNSCIPCPAKVWMLVEPIAVIALCILFYLIILWQYQYDKKTNRKDRSIMDVIVSRLKIVLGFYQVIGEFFASLHDVNWTGILQVIGEAISTVELTILRVLVRPQCYDARLEMNPKIEFIFGTSLPLLIFIVAILLFQAKRCYILYKRRKANHRITPESELLALKSKLSTVVLGLLFVSYPPICSVIFQLYPRACKTFCLDHDESTCIRRLRSDFDIDCDQLSMYHYAAYIATFIYVVPFPLILLLLLRKYCHRENHPNDVDTDDAFINESSGSERRPLLQPNTSLMPTRSIPIWLYFLCENYKPKFWYWEIVELSRKVSQTLLITLFGWEDKLTVLMTIGTSVLFLTMHARFWPMKDSFDQRLQMFSLSAIFINVLVAAMQVPESYEGTISIALVLLNVIVIFILAAKVFLGFILRLRKLQIGHYLMSNAKKRWYRFTQRTK